VDFETVEGAVTHISVEPSIAMVAPTGVDTFKSPKERSLVKVVLVKMIVKRMNWLEP